MTYMIITNWLKFHVIMHRLVFCVYCQTPIIYELAEFGSRETTHSVVYRMFVLFQTESTNDYFSLQVTE